MSGSTLANSEEYVDYISRCGEDNDLYYDIKIQASQLLMDNTDNTFVTPVFNGSASLRDAAGHMIESVAKSMRRKEPVNDAYFSKLYSETESLYRLDQLSGGDGMAKEDLGPLPTTAVLLIAALALAWLLIIVYAVVELVRKKAKQG